MASDSAIRPDEPPRTSAEGDPPGAARSAELAASVMTEVELRRALGEGKARADEAERSAAELARARAAIARGAPTTRSGRARARRCSPRPTR
ncbi:MAG TPA: hypothetical protein VFS43_16775 [Polyangiaceae bacterium]|nr:hypothetical protein [Polyangiaceae bacterium]